MATQNIAPLLAKGLDDNFGMEYKRIPKTYPKVFHVHPIGGRIVQVQGWIPLGLPVERAPGEFITQDQIRPDFDHKMIVVGYGKELALADEDAMDDQYGLVVRWCSQRGGQLALAYATLEDRVGADYFAVTGFTTTSPAPGSMDGDSLFSTSHPMSAADTATTWSNRPATDINLGMGALQAARANLEQQFMANGQSIISNGIARLIVNPNYHEIALQLQKGEWEPKTADNNMNTMRGTFDVISWPYFRKTGATAPTNDFNGWFVQGDMHDANWYNREEVKFDEQRDGKSRSMLFFSHRRFVAGHHDARGHYGSPGS